MPATAGIKSRPEIDTDMSEREILEELIREAAASSDRAICLATINNLHRQIMADAAYPRQGTFVNAAAELLLQSQLALMYQAIQTGEIRYRTSLRPDADAACDRLHRAIQGARAFMQYIAGERDVENGFIECLEQSYQANREWATEMLGCIKSGKWPHTTKTFAEAVFDDPQDDRSRKPGVKYAAKDIFRQAKRNIVQERAAQGSAARFVDNAAAAAAIEILYRPHLKELVQKLLK